jgi:hypothetical protein
MKLKVFSLSIVILIAWFIPGCYVGSVNQDSSNQYSSPYPEYNVDDLNQYGQWENVSPYGSVWSPSVVNNWQPFSYGHWDYDGYNWVWVSYEPFGWIVYHYGSWDYSPGYGWYWIPDYNEWSPACVQWIDYDDNVCWAPRRPLNKPWTEPWEVNNVHPWMVVKMKDFNREDINSYRVPYVSRENNPDRIQRRQPNVKTIQRFVKVPISVVKFERDPVATQSPPVRTNVPPDRNIPPDKINPPRERTSTPQEPNRGDINSQPPGNRRLFRIQVPPAERQKVDKYRPKVEKEVLVKKEPRKQK